jgi:glucose/mannose-6-phosphate isomerase
MKTRSTRKRKAVKGASTNLRKNKPIISESLLRKIDPSDLKADYNAWPSLASSAWSETEVPFFDGNRFDRVIFAGMGGSSLTGELLSDIAREKGSRVSFESLKDYHISNSNVERTLVIGMSASGTTEETLSALSEAHRKGMTAFSFGSGGLLETFSKEKWGFGFIRTKMLKVPRSSLPGIFYPVLKLLVKNKLIEVPDNEIDESIRVMNESQKNLAKDFGKLKDEILSLAKAWTTVSSIFPLLYSSNRTRAVGLRARQSINENAKLHAFNGEIPELCHNEIVGWDYKASLVGGGTKWRRNDESLAVLLRLSEDDPVEVKTRFDIVQDVVRKAGGSTIGAPYSGTSYLARTISMLYLLDYASYYMAIMMQVDPIKTPSIQLLKRELAERLNYVEKL